MKQHFLRAVIAGLAGLGAIFTLQANVNAASQYSARRSSEVKLIWRKAMGRYAFTAPTGARFSKHLGTRYGYNTETANVTWYTDAHEKLYLKNLHMYSIYYHVTNSDQSLQGWIWKGYLKPVGNDDSGSGDSTGTSGSSSASTSTAFPNSISQELAGFFTGTQPNSQLQKIANQYPKYVGKDADFQEWASKTYFQGVSVDFSFLDSDNDYVATTALRKQLIAHQLSFKDYVTKVAVWSDSAQSKLNAFPNSQIGAYAFPSNSSLYGQGVIIVVGNGELPNS